MFLHVPDHLVDPVLFLRLIPAVVPVPAEQQVAQLPQQFVQVVDGLARGQGENIVDLMHGAAARQGCRVRMHQGVDYVAVDHPEREGRHVRVLQEMQQVADPLVQHLPVPDRQRLADGVGDLARLGQDLRQVGGDVAVPEHFLAAHHKTVFIRGRGFQVGRRRFREIAVRQGDGGNAPSPAVFSLAADHFRHFREDLRIFREDQVQVRFQGNQLHAGARIPGKAAEGSGGQVQGMILFAAQDHREHGPVDFQSDRAARCCRFLPGIKPSLHKPEYEIVPLYGQRQVKPGRQFLVPRRQRPDPAGNLLQLVPRRFAIRPGKHSRDRADRVRVPPCHPQREGQAQYNKDGQDRQAAENLPEYGSVDVRVPQHGGIGQAPVLSGERDLRPVLAVPAENP